MSHACAVRISAHHPVPIVNSKQDCRNGARRIDREVQRPIGIPVVAVKDSCGVYIVSHRQLFVIIDLVSKGPEQLPGRYTTLRFRHGRRTPGRSRCRQDQTRR